jgi:hypothetical protein
MVGLTAKGLKEMRTRGAARRSSMLWSPALSLLWLAGSAALDGAAAQNVVNSNFSFPSAASAPNKIIEDPPTSAQIGWTFSKATPNNTSGVQANGSAFNAPAAPDGLPQTAYIDDLGSISQNINFTRPGDYELSFQIAEYPHGSLSGSTQESVMVQIGTTQYGPFTPNSSTSFNQPKPIQFKVATANSLVGLTFVGTGPNATQLAQGEVGAVFIAKVAINAVAPQIACPSNLDIDPTSTVTLSGQHFGSVPGKIRINFPKPSQVKFANTAFPNDASDSDLDLDVSGAWGDEITSKALDKASPVGAPPAQPVKIYVIGANGVSSNGCNANFHNTPVITGVLWDSITPGQSFNVKGWDFGGDTGKVTIYFSNNLFHSSSLDSKGDKDAQIGKDKWTPAVVNATVPKDITAVVEQTVDISLTPKGGNASNSWKEKFNPTMDMGLAPVLVVQCSSNTSLDLCNPAPGSYSGGGVCLGIDPAGIAPFGDNIWGYHESCAWFSSDNGTDIYSAIPASPWWTITNVDHSWEGVPPGVSENDGNGATIEYDVNPLPPALVVSVIVNWNITPGGIADYEFNVWMKGPAGVPAQ